MKATLLNGRIYFLENNQLREVTGYGEFLEVHYKMWRAHMELYTPCKGLMKDAEVVEGYIYEITNKDIAFVTV